MRENLAGQLVLLCTRQGVGLKTLSVLVCCRNLRLNVADLMTPVQATQTCAPSSLDPGFSLCFTRLLVAGLVARGREGHLRRAASRKLVATPPPPPPPPVPQPTKLSRQHQLRCVKRSACMCSCRAESIKLNFAFPSYIVRNTRTRPS